MDPRSISGYGGTNLWLVLKLGAPAFYVPLTTLAEHSGYVTRDYRLFAIGSAVLVGAWLTAQLLRGLGLSDAMSVNVAVITTAAVATGNWLARGVPGGELGFGLLLLAFLTILILVRRPRLVSYAVSWLSLSLWLLVVSSFAQAFLNAEHSLLNDHAGLPTLELDDPSGDVVVLVMDEFPNLEFASSHLGLDGKAMARALRNDGFVVDEALPVAYAFTELGMPAFFLLDLPAGEGDTISETTRRDLVAVVGGRNPFVQAFRDAGYSITVVESGWSGLRCMELVDRCVERSWYDEVTASVLGQSLGASVIGRALGSPFSHGAERVIEWIRVSLPAIADDGTDDLILIHLMLPHTPVAFDEHCARLEEEKALGPATLSSQVKCARSIIEEVSSITARGRATIIMGDHGSKVLGQTELPPEEWNDDMISERMRTMVAVRGIDDCSEPRARSSANVGIRLLRCLGADIGYVDDVSFTTSVHGEPLVDIYPP